jgi:hypothetical protein
MTTSNDVILQFAQLYAKIQDRKISSIYIKNLTALRDFFLARKEILIRHPVVLAITQFRPAEHYEWKFIV